MNGALARSYKDRKNEEYIINWKVDNKNNKYAELQTSQ